MPSALHPTDGVRVLLEHDDVAPDQLSASASASVSAPGASAPVVYRASIFTPRVRADYSVTFDEAGQPTLSSVAAPVRAPVAEGGDEVPAEVDPRALDVLRAIARTAGRHALSSTPPRWPPRIVRWRKL